MANPNPGYDVFLSHNSADKPAVEQLARRLLDAGIQPWLDTWNLIPGDPWQEGLEEALDTCATCAVFMGPSGVGPWHNEELRVALDRRARDRTRTFRVIPVLLPGANPADPNTLPRFLSRMTWVDFRSGLDDANAFSRLLAGIRGVAPGPGLGSSSMPSQLAGSASTAAPASALTTNQRQRLEDELARMQTQYETYTRRLAALDTDIGRALNSLEKQVLEDRRADLLSERQKIADQMDAIEGRLAVRQDLPYSGQSPEGRDAAGPQLATQTGVRLTVHLAYLIPDSTPAAFINATNLTSSDVVVTHVWIDYGRQIHVLRPDRILPIRLKPLDTWETWIELEQLPADIGEDIFRRARIKLSTGQVVESQPNVGVPEAGFVPGGPRWHRYVKPPDQQ